MYDDDPLLFLAGAAGVGQLAFTGNLLSLAFAVIAIASVVAGLLLLRFAAALRRRAHAA